MKIVVFTPPRTGSTLLYNILQEYFPNDEIKKVHEFEDGDLIFTTIRDPRDSVLSIDRVKNNNLKLSVREIKFAMSIVIQNYNKINEIFRYEEFYNNPNFWMGKMKKYTNRTVSEEILKKIISPIKRKELIESMGMTDFNTEWDDETQLHANHIGENFGKLSLHRTRNYETQQFLTKTLSKELKFFKYN